MDLVVFGATGGTGRLAPQPEVRRRLAPIDTREPAAGSSTKS
jgi:hypothetical protein